MYIYISIANRNEQHGGYPLLWRELISFEDAQHDAFRWGLWRGKWFGLRNADGTRCLMAKMSQNGMNKYITHHVHVTCIFIHIFLIIYWYNYIHALWITMIFLHLIYGEKMREKPTDIRRAKSSHEVGDIWWSEVCQLHEHLVQLCGWPICSSNQMSRFFRNNTHTLGCLFCGVLWGKWFSLLKRFFGWLPPTVLYIYLPVPGGTNHFRPTVSAHFSPSLLWFSGWVAFFCLRAQAKKWHRACLDGLFACSLHQFFCEGLLNFLLSLFSVRNCVLNLSPNICGSLFCSLQKVSGASGAFRNTSRNVLWQVSPNVIYSIWNQSQSLAIFLGRFPERFSGGFYQSWSMYHCRTSMLKENNTPVHLHSAKDQSWYSLDLFQKSNFQFHLISSYFRPWTAKSKWMSNVPRCLVTCDSWKGFGDKSGAEVNRCPRSPGETEGSPTLAISIGNILETVWDRYMRLKRLQAHLVKMGNIFS